MKLIKMIFIGILCFSFIGCASYGNKINAGYVDKIEKGKTTEKEIVANLGNPMSVSITPEGHKFLMYMYTYAQTKASSFIPFVGAFTGGADTSTQMLQIWLDKNGIVTNFAFTNSQSEMNTGILAN